MDIPVSIDKNLGIHNEILYVLKTLGNNKSITFTETDHGIEIGSSTSHLPVSENFISNFLQHKFSPSENLNNKGFVEFDNGEHDYLSTAFYMLASLQEYNRSSYDMLGRFQFQDSYQSTLNISKENTVQYCFDKLAEQLNLPNRPTPTRFFLSHDIDTVYESILQDGWYVLKKGRFDIFLKLLFNVAMSRPDWLNMDTIMSLESEYDCTSTFFWIVKKGKEEKLKNADYRFSSSRIQNILADVPNKGFENGLHKSVASTSFQEELSSFNKRPISNRYHYLKFNLPSGYDAIEQAGLKLDASLGFAETIGFRNNYGLPYNPYNLKERRPYSFIELPLHVMDTTLFKYAKANVADAENEIISFFEKNKQDCVLSVLWHNNFFSNYKYKGYLPLYKKILGYIKENNFKTINQKEIIEKYSITWP
jgi:hypothetical protein